MKKKNFQDKFSGESTDLLNYLGSKSFLIKSIQLKMYLKQAWVRILSVFTLQISEALYTY